MGHRDYSLPIIHFPNITFVDFHFRIILAFTVFDITVKSVFLLSFFSSGATAPQTPRLFFLLPTTPQISRVFFYFSRYILIYLTYLHSAQ